MRHAKKNILFVADSFARLLDIRGAVYILRNGRRYAGDRHGSAVVNRGSDLIMSSWSDVGMEIRKAYIKVKNDA